MGAASIMSHKITVNNNYTEVDDACFFSIFRTYIRIYINHINELLYCIIIA